MGQFRDTETFTERPQTQDNPAQHQGGFRFPDIPGMVQDFLEGFGRNSGAQAQAFTDSEQFNGGRVSSPTTNGGNAPFQDGEQFRPPSPPVSTPTPVPTPVAPQPSASPAPTTGSRDQAGTAPRREYQSPSAPSSPAQVTTGYPGHLIGIGLLNNGYENWPRGPVVRQIQQRLLELGYSLGRWGADGTYGTATEAAILKFQAAQNIKQDGIVGPVTWERLFRTTS